MKKIVLICVLLLALMSYAQHSVARQWNETLLEAIRNDLARPTVHARNLFHSSVLMYDAWAVFNENATTVFLGKNFGNYTCAFDGIATPDDPQSATHEVMSYALFRLLNHRFRRSPGADETQQRITDLMNSLGYDENITTTDYSDGSYAALGNYMAEKLIEFGLQDGSNEQNDYVNRYYEPVNEPLALNRYTDQNNIDPNRWQPLAFNSFVDQSGNVFTSAIPPFLSPEWGEVVPFALKADELNVVNNGFDSYVYQDPGAPDYIQNSSANGIDDPYKWGFALVLAWSSHMDPDDATVIDISPGSLGNLNITDLPRNFEGYKSFYNFLDGGDIGQGHAINPKTNMPYAPQLVKRSDYTRVLAEFWADGPDSETPPGHWFTILNYVNDHPETVKRFKGTGDILDDLQWDVKTYLTLGGAMHDAAVCVWGIKGYYDYVRPISAIRYMAWKGQSTDPSLANFDPHGLPLIPGIIEVIERNDPLAIQEPAWEGRIKVYGWLGPDKIVNPDTDVAGVGWQLGTRWWPYQRGTFVTPNFAGYLSGHSTFSRAAATVLTQVTGDPFFPGGIGVFEVEQNEFLVFEEGPSESFELQWATYSDASDQTSLSRIWGGIHPPIDDIRGRIIGEKIGNDAFQRANGFFEGTAGDLVETALYPVPTDSFLNIRSNFTGAMTLKLYDLNGRLVMDQPVTGSAPIRSLDISQVDSGIYVAQLYDANAELLENKKLIVK